MDAINLRSCGSFGTPERNVAMTKVRTELTTARDRPPTSWHVPILGRTQSMDNSSSRRQKVTAKREPRYARKAGARLQTLDRIGTS